MVRKPSMRIDLVDPTFQFFRIELCNEIQILWSKIESIMDFLHITKVLRPEAVSNSHLL
jgi:hypothetical protein